MQLLTSEQIKEIEEREQQKLIQKELEQQQLREIEMKRRDAERKAIEQLREQQRQNVEPLYSSVMNLTEDEYLVMQYMNVNGRVREYRFKSKDDTPQGEFFIGFTRDFEPYVSNGSTSNQIIIQNVLGLEVRKEMIADVIEIQGVKYQRLLVDKPVDKVIQGQVKSMKGEWK